MLRETLQTLAYLSVLSSTYSLHLTRDSYIRKPMTDINLVDMVDDRALLASQQQQKLQLQKHQSQELNMNNNNNIEQSFNDIHEISHLNHRPKLDNMHPPRGFQELFGVVTNFDIRAQQQKLAKQQQQQQENKQLNSDDSLINPIKRASSSSSTSSMNGVLGGSGSLPPIPHGIASQLMLRSARGQRQYDVPQIGM